ncbi:MAG: hypothetical protein U0667_18760 [Chloroflexota bacterium]
MRHFGWLGAILALVAVLVAGSIGFAIGAASTVPAGTAVTHVAWGFPFWGFPFFGLFGLLFLFLLIGLVARGARRAAWAGGPAGPRPWGGPGWHGQAPWAPGRDDPRRQVFEEWHREAHASPSPEAMTDADAS